MFLRAGKTFPMTCSSCRKAASRASRWWTPKPAPSATAVAINEMPGQHLLEVAREGQEGPVLIPVVDEFLEGVDEQTRCIYVNVPQGLLDL